MNYEVDFTVWNHPTVKKMRRELSDRWDMVRECEKWRGKFSGTPGVLIERIWEHEEKWARFCQTLLLHYCKELQWKFSTSHGIRMESAIPITQDVAP